MAGNDKEPKRKKIDLPKLFFLAISACLIFLYGVAVPLYDLFPNRQILFVRDSFRTVKDEFATLTGLKPTHFVHAARYPGKDITRNVVGRTYPGLTFMAGFFDNNNEMRLIRADGSVVNRWPVKFYDIFSNVDHIQPKSRAPHTDWNTFIHGAQVLPDGSVIFNFEYDGLARLDRCGEVLWRRPFMTHHSLSPSSDGAFWISSRKYATSVSKFPPLKAPYWEDFIIKVSADGKTLKEISVPGLLYRNGLWPLFLANGLLLVKSPELELVHLNDIEELTDDKAAAFPQFSSGDLLVSLRELNLIFVVDPNTGIIKWHRTGPWLRQHDPDFQRDGTITVFNNRTDNTENGEVLGGSEITVIDPKSGKTWTWPKIGERPKFYTNVGGKHQIFPNGNILITEYKAGRVVELDSRGKIVWEYINRFNEKETADISSAERYPENYFTVTDWKCQ